MPPTSLSRLVGANIANRRKLLGMSQERLAEVVGLNQVSVSRMESGALAPRFSTLEKLASALNCPVQDFFRPQGQDASIAEASIADMISPLSQNAKGTFLEVMAKTAQMLLNIKKEK